MSGVLHGIMLAGKSRDLTGVKALLLGNGTNGSTTITDTAGVGDWTAGGDAALSTSIKKYGSASINCSGSTGYVRASANASNYALSGDFTVEFWFYLPTVLTDTILMDFRDSTYTSNPTIIVDALSAVQISGFNITGAGLPQQQWIHLALCRSGSSVRLFLNGTQSGTTATNSTNYSGTQPTLGGRYTNNFRSAAYFDDVRISTTARYTANFTAPDEL